MFCYHEENFSEGFSQKIFALFNFGQPQILELSLGPFDFPPPRPRIKGQNSRESGMQYHFYGGRLAAVEMGRRSFSIRLSGERIEIALVKAAIRFFS